RLTTTTPSRSSRNSGTQAPAGSRRRPQPGCPAPACGRRSWARAGGGGGGRSAVAGGNRVVLHQLVAGEAARVRRWQVAAGELLLQLLLARHDALAQRLDVEAGPA